MKITIRGNTFELLPEKAVFWHEEGALLLADVHLGKIMHFRKNGSNLPLASQQTDFERMTKLLDQWKPEQIIFLGDLFHSEINTTWHQFEAWIKQQKGRFILISGNHDIIDPKYYELIRVKVLPSLTQKAFSLTHKPEDIEGFNICGHIHPGIKLKGAGSQRLKLPCFHVSPHRLTLPAFGSFTGLHYVYPAEKDQIFAIADHKVIEMNA